MSTLTRHSSSAPRSILRSNPILTRLSKITERSETDAATYRGIAVKTGYFLLLTLLGVLAQLLVKTAMAHEPVWQVLTVYETFTVSLTQRETIIVAGVLLAGVICQLVAVFARKTIPVTGSVYAASQGYVISFLVFRVLTGYEYLGMEALMLTIAVVAVMSWLYASGIVKADKKFRTVLMTLMLGSIGVGLLSFLGMLIPAVRPYVQTMMNNAALSVTLDVIGLVIAALFLISDFSVVDECVQQSYPRSYEWSAAFGLVFTVIWIYLKILDLLMQFAGKDKD